MDPNDSRLSLRDALRTAALAADFLLTGALYGRQAERTLLPLLVRTRADVRATIGSS
jgi:hypothetical protein